jgi:hypothetical protein
MTRRAVAAEPRPAAGGPVPGAVALVLDREIRIGVSSEPIQLAGGELRVLSVGKGTFHLSSNLQLTAKLHAGAAQYAIADFRIYAAVFDAQGAARDGVACGIRPARPPRQNAHNVP